MLIHNVHFYECKNNGCVQVTSPLSHLTIENCLLEMHDSDPGGYGISANAGSPLWIVGNRILGSPTTAGISVANVDGSVIARNYIAAAGTAIWIRDGAANAAIYQNELASGGILDQGTGVRKYLNAGANVGGLPARTPYAARTADYTVAMTETATLFGNAGAAGAITFTLPLAAQGLNFCFYVHAAQTVSIAPAGGDRIHHLTDNTGDRISSNTEGDGVCLVAIDDDYWIPLQETGTWTDDN